MQSFPKGFRALVIGSSGAIGAALAARLRADPQCSEAVGLHRQSLPRIDFENEETIAAAAEALSREAPFDLIIITTGLLHSPRFMPERRFSDLNYAQMFETFRINAFGPALIFSHFSKLVGNDRAVIAVLSAKVGSIADNRLGGVVQLSCFQGGAKHVFENRFDRDEENETECGLGRLASWHRNLLLVTAFPRR